MAHAASRIQLQYAHIRLLRDFLRLLRRLKPPGQEPHQCAVIRLEQFLNAPSALLGSQRLARALIHVDPLSWERLQFFHPVRRAMHPDSRSQSSVASVGGNHTPAPNPSTQTSSTPMPRCSIENLTPIHIKQLTPHFLKWDSAESRKKFDQTGGYAWMIRG